MSVQIGTKRARSPSPGTEPGPSSKRGKTTDETPMLEMVVSATDIEMKTAESSPKKSTVARLAPRKPRKHLTRGAWRQMIQMPYEVLDKIFAHFTPRELLRLSRVDKGIRCAILTVWNPRAFIAARANLFDAPAPPPGMSEPEFASYIAERVCSTCGGTAVVVEPTLRVRSCAQHLRGVAVALTKDYYQHLGVAEYEDKKVPNFQDIVKLLPSKLYNNRTWARKEDVCEFVNAWRQAAFVDSQSNIGWRYQSQQYQYTYDRIRQYQHDSKGGKELNEWRDRVRLERQRQIMATVDERKLAISTRLEPLGYPSSDLDFNKELAMNNEWASICHQPEVVTDEHWERILPQIKTIMEARRKARALKQKHAAKIGRRGFVERNVLGALREEIETAPWGAGEAEERLNVMKPLLHAVVPHIDIMPIARTFIKGHTSKPPSHLAVVTDTKSTTQLHFLRIRAFLAKMVLATDEIRVTTQANSRTVVLGAETLREIERSVQGMTLEALLEGDVEVKRLLFHPAAFFRPKNLIDPSKLASEDPTPDYIKKNWTKSNAPAHYSLSEISHKFIPANPFAIHSKTLGDRTTISNSAKSFYPAVFKDSKRPPHTTVQAREVQVDIALRETAVYLLARSEPRLDEEKVMDMALRNVMGFVCELCGACKAKKIGMMTWTQIVAHYADVLNRHPHPADLHAAPMDQDRAQFVQLHQAASIRIADETELSKAKYILHRNYDTSSLEGRHGYGCPCDGGLEAKQVINSRYTAETNHFRSLPGHLDSLMLQLTREAQAQATMEYDMA